MTSIGIRELRQHASRWIEKVKAGETVEVTERGTPVARLVPIPDERDVLTRLIEEGKARPPASPRGWEQITPLPRGDGPSPSEVLAQMREHER